MILIDTSGLLAAMFSDQNRHAECAAALLDAEPPRIMSPFVLAELDYMIVKYAGVDAEMRFLQEIETRVYDIAQITIQDIIEAHHVVSQYKSLRIGLADAMTVHLANRFSCRDVLTLDERHFRAMSPRGRRGFRILPADSSPSAERMKRAARSRRR